MLKIRDSDSEHDKDKSGDNTSATNYAFLIKFCLTISFTPSISFLISFSIKFSNLITRVSDVPTTSLISFNSRIKIPNSFSLSFCKFTKCVIINPVIVIINNTTQHEINIACGTVNPICSNDKPNIANDSIRTNAINPNHFIVLILLVVMKVKVLVVMKLVIYEKNDEHHYDVRHP